jgi:hypothetical protein
VGILPDFRDGTDIVASMLAAHARDSLSADERLAEIAEILAIGLQRAWARKSSALLPRERGLSLEPLGQQSGGVAGTEGDAP